MSQAINIRALQWAFEQEELSVTAKAVLMTFAIHANGDDRFHSSTKKSSIKSSMLKN